VARNYNNKFSISFDADESAAVGQALSDLTLPQAMKDEAANLESFASLGSFIAELEKRGAEDQDAAQAASTLKTRLQKTLNGDSFQDALEELIEGKIPAFFYYADYANLPYTVDIQRVLTSEEKGLNDGQLTARSLLRMAGAEREYLLNPNYERRKRELENVANALTDDVLKYWTQNPELRVLPDITQRLVQASPPTPGQPTQTLAIDELKIRIWDQRHSLSLPFTEHSTGFQWFFSFLAAFSEYEFRDTPVIILLDEPALGLHARAQKDFIRFIEERLAKRCQVIYTTHSPFMVQPGKLERVRLVEDRGPEHGAKVSQDVLTTDPDTLFPLQGALGYDLAQNLFIAPNNLVVEGTSDYTYLTVVSDYLKQQAKRQYLDERWSIIPVGGADLIPTFVALLGTRLEITVLVDAQKAGHQRLSRLAANGYLAKQRIVTIGQVLGRVAADIEDLFTDDEYLLLFNDAFHVSIKPSDVSGTGPIVSRIARHRKIERFDHGRPADILLRRRDELLPKLSDTTLKNFETLFARINDTLALK
jgi:hypothetical protein